jgi:hypothetical protein
MINDDALHRIILCPSLQLRSHRMNHVKRQRVKCRWAVQADGPSPTIDPGDNVCGHWRNKSRPTIIRIT